MSINRRQRKSANNLEQSSIVIWHFHLKISKLCSKESVIIITTVQTGKIKPINTQILTRSHVVIK